ncbi:hypothetical protein V6G44_000436 [Burkholderia multivorans]|uniref:hypothetical protein n=1 Tax=Burkholderia multivorans TaxID=87883 RepID=UPI0015E30194|nr:hypothetical protein [Burkholderia multivorans]MCL4627609.1 hypothetical protein [Burkholderia multivorans]MCO1358239.1 hypothetical protein [Burkholderia multivorans]MCO1384600.1 hypothetical protein [Burkholderia multivorans]MCO1390894.1 hypothetical protein [Burkholderia multivorans]MCO1399765.1 hypothetical protein [Burkholderia multivorans]
MVDESVEVCRNRIGGKPGAPRIGFISIRYIVAFAARSDPLEHRSIRAPRRSGGHRTIEIVNDTLYHFGLQADRTDNGRRRRAMHGEPIAEEMGKAGKAAAAPRTERPRMVECRTVAARPPRDGLHRGGGAARTPAYGAKNTSVRFVKLPEFVCTNSGWNDDDGSTSSP